MKISENKYLGLRFDIRMQQATFNSRKADIDKNSYGEDNERTTARIKELVSNDNTKYYLMSAPSLEISKKIKVGEEKFDGRMFHGLPNGKKVTILVNENLFYRYYIMDGSIFCLWITTEPILHEGEEQTYMQYTTFRIDTQNGYLSYPNENPFEVELFKNFIQYLIFLEFSELETVTLKPNVKIGTKKQGQYFNESKSNIVIVDSTWNRIIIKVGEFQVQPHLRLQPYGEGMLKRKLIYIDGFTKEGYTRNAKKEIVN